MTDVFIGQIMLTGFSFAPSGGWAQCNGQLMSIPQNQALFALLGTMYGGNGVQNFALPDLRGRSAVGGGFASVDPAWQPSPYPQGMAAGEEQVTLLLSQTPMHTHAFGASTSSATQNNPTGCVFAQSVATPAESIYVPSGGTLVPLAGQTVTNTGGNGPHNNEQPSAVVNFNIATRGIWPSRG